MEPGRVLKGRYRIDAIAGSGGMGTVYRAHDLETNGTCAIKLVRQTTTTDHAAARFKQEAEALASIRHPAVVRYVDHGVDEGIPFLVMEWVEGESLADRLHTATPPLDRALDLAQRLADALVAIHAAGIVHRDLKPRNVMLPAHGWNDARIVDFGIARTRSAGMTESGVRLGTPRYMSPEQVLHARKVDGRADVFSLGCVLFELVTGQRAYRGGDEVAVLARVVIEDAPRAKRVRAALPDAVDDLVARLLARDVRKRPNAAEAIRAIDIVRRSMSMVLEGPPPANIESDDATHPFSTDEDLPSSFSDAPASALPSARGVFVGRAREMGELSSLVEPAGTVSVWGPMGVGKSRLMLEVARRTRRSTFWVDLHRARDLEAALHIVAIALGLPQDDSDPHAIAYALGQRPSPLLVLDGVDGVHAEIVSLARSWASKDTTIVVISRARASLDRALELASLDPDPACDLVRLRAAEAGSNLSAPDAANIAKMLEGNPLAIELAAARIPMLGAQGLARRLAQPLDVLGTVKAHEYAFTLRESLMLSWDLLSEDDRHALAESSVFAADFDIEGAEAVLSTRPVLDRLQSLRDKSLVMPIERGARVCFSLYGAVRELARQKLAELGLEAKTRAAHARWAVDRAEQLAAKEGNPAAMRELSEMLLDLLQAFAYALEASPELALRAVVASDPILRARGPLSAHIGRLDAAIASGGSNALVRQARQARGRALALERKLDQAFVDFDAALEDAKKENDEEGIASVLLDRGVALQSKGDLAGAEKCYRDVLSRRDRVGNARLLARALGNLGALAHDRWDLDVAYKYYVEAVALAEASGDPRLLGHFLGHLAVLDQERGGLAAARHRLHRALRSLEEAGDRRLLAIAYGNLGTLELERGRADLALESQNRSCELLDGLGDVRAGSYAHARRGAALASQNMLDEARTAFAKAEQLGHRDPLALGVIEVQRAFIALAESDRELAEAIILGAREREPSGRTLEEKTDEARAAIRILTKRMKVSS